MRAKNHHASSARRQSPADSASTHSGTTAVKPAIDTMNSNQRGMGNA